MTTTNCENVHSFSLEVLPHLLNNVASDDLIRMATNHLQDHNCISVHLKQTKIIHQSLFSGSWLDKSEYV